MPWELLEKKLRASQENGLLYVAGMLAVPYFEKALYELPEEEVTPERVLALADEVEELVQIGRSPRYQHHPPKTCSKPHSRIWLI